MEIFKTDDNRGWGLRCKEDLYMGMIQAETNESNLEPSSDFFSGQFVDTYRGEVITDEEATRREEASGIIKASYLYSLDKHAEAEGLSKEESMLMHHPAGHCIWLTMSYSLRRRWRIHGRAFEVHESFMSTELPSVYCLVQQARPQDIRPGILRDP